MRKVLVTCALSVMLVIALAPLAAAQGGRDPFALVISLTEPDGLPTDPTDPVIDPDPAPVPVDPLPSTGARSDSWMGLAYALVALGGGAVVLSRLVGPTATRQRVRT